MFSANPQKLNFLRGGQQQPRHDEDSPDWAMLEQMRCLLVIARARAVGEAPRIMSPRSQCLLEQSGALLRCAQSVGLLAQPSIWMRRLLGDFAVEFLVFPIF